MILRENAFLTWKKVDVSARPFLTDRTGGRRGLDSLRNAGIRDW